MAKLRIYRVPNQVAWSASGNINQELSPIPFPITGVMLILNVDITTSGGPTNYNDYWDRIISNLSLTGFANGQNKTFFQFSNMRAAYHLSRFQLRDFAVQRPTFVANSQTNNLMKIAYFWHFGTRPFKNSGEFDHMDLSAGIPETQKGQLTLNGTWASGTNVVGSATSTTNDADMDIYLFGVQAEPGDAAPPIPQAFPVWSMTTPTPTATSTIFGTPYNITSGNFLRALMVMGTRGLTYPRDQQIFNSLRIYDQRENRDVVSFGGRAGAGDAGGGDYIAAEYITQLGLNAAPRSDDVRQGTVALPSNSQPTDPGLVYFKFSDYTTRVHPLYGADLRGVATGDYRLDMGLNNVTTIATDVVYERYELNPLHPANAAYL